MAVAAPSRFSGELAGRLLRGFLTLAAIVVIVVGGLSAFLTYSVVTARNDTETVTPLSSFQSNYVNLSFTDQGGREHDGWLLVGNKGSPAIVLCHGHNSNRSELLALGSVLRQNHFNVYLFNFNGPKVKRFYSDLGLRQVGDLQAAIEKVVKQPGVNPHRVGLYGVTSGGYAALAVAEQNPLVKALVVDTAYEDPSQMLEAEVDLLLGGSSKWFRMLPDAGFQLATWGKKKPQIRANLPKLEGMPQLYIQGRDSPLLAAAAEAIYDSAPQSKRMLVFENSYTSLASGAVKKEYEDQVLNFFLQNLPLRAD